MVGIGRGIVQQVRNGVVINSWDLMKEVTIADGGSPMGYRTPTVLDQQRVLLQLGKETVTAALEKQKTDLAVAIWYRGDDPSGQELRSPYVYLTDQKIAEIHAGQLIELTFDQLNVAEITGISVATAGNLTASVDAAWADNRQISTEDGNVAVTKGEYSFAQPLTVANVPYRMNASGAIKPLDLTFTTDAATENMSGGTNGPVRMTLGYYTAAGDLKTVLYDDIRQYIEGNDRRFLAGSTMKLRILESDMAELRWIELEPYRDARDSVTTKAMWNLKELTAALGENGFVSNRSVGRLIVEGSPLRISMADILMTATVTVSGNAKPVGEDGTLELLLKSGETVSMTPTLEGSAEGMTATLNSDVGGFLGDADLGDTRGFTAEYIQKKVQEAHERGVAFSEAMEAASTDSGRAAAQRGAEQAAKDEALWKSIQPETGSWQIGSVADIEAGLARAGGDGTLILDGNGITATFVPPGNYTDSVQSYRITVVSKENPAASVVLYISVSSEPDPTKKSQEELSQELIDAQNAQSDAQNENNENLMKIIEELMGKALLGEDGRLYPIPAGTIMRTPVGVGDGAMSVQIFGITGRVRHYATKDGRTRVTETAKKSMQNIGRGLVLGEQPEAVACLIRYVLTRPAVLTFAYENGVPTLTAWAGRGLSGRLSLRRAIKAFEKGLPDTMTASEGKLAQEER
ncbi:MAG: hypothetical protein E7211_21840, partial [Clostridium lundense]|nr:hypothetical protein [Clostridium lundense]